MTPAQQEVLRAVIRDASGLSDESVQWDVVSGGFVADRSAVLELISSAPLHLPEQIGAEQHVLHACNVQVTLDSVEAHDATSLASLVALRLRGWPTLRDTLFEASIGVQTVQAIRGVRVYDERAVATAVIDLMLTVDVSDAPVSPSWAGPIMIVESEGYLDGDIVIIEAN